MSKTISLCFQMLAFIYFILFYGVKTSAFDLLPGIDDVSAGYDAAKMLSASEQNSKYRIFDLTDLKTEPYVTKTVGTHRNFSTPKLVQVTDVSVRKEDSCQTVAYTFESFFRRLVFSFEE